MGRQPLRCPGPSGASSSAPSGRLLVPLLLRVLCGHAEATAEYCNCNGSGEAVGRDQGSGAAAPLLLASAVFWSRQVANAATLLVPLALSQQ